MRHSFYSSPEDKEKSLQRQCSVQTSSLPSALLASAKLKSVLNTFPKNMQAAMYASVSQLKEAMAAISTGQLGDVDNCSLERGQTVIGRSRHSAPPSGG